MRHGLTIIAFVGSVFSPYYAFSRRRGPADPGRHCALNVALYGRPRRWAMAERGSATRDADTLAIGPSALHWDGATLVIDIDEPTAPLPGRIKGQVRVMPSAFTGARFMLDPDGAHRWSPIAPRAAVEVVLDRPGLSWSGIGYLDCNEGAEPLERRFSRWTWSRCVVGDETAILYDVRRRDGSAQSLALHVGGDGVLKQFDAPPMRRLPRTNWQVGRETRSEGAARLVLTLEDTPFYTRSVLETELLGRTVPSVHESLSLDRFRSPVVQAMLAARMPRLG